ncbi:MAG: RnfABCDGE type electron transport complex subunit G [Bacteroidales bacterium]|nr:RnfABCDGE type electron transport complex subunit G [Bacteroidales bacterium]
MAKKTESTFVNMLLTLFIITAVAAFALAGVYELTKEPIEKAKLAKKIAALKQVLPAFDTVISQNIEFPDMALPLGFNYALKDGDTVGIAVETFTMNGFSGLIRAMVGFAPDGTIIDVVHLEHKETPGLGDKVDKKKSPWSDQFKGKHPGSFKLKVVKDGGDVDAITAATITSRAYSDAIDRAFIAFKEQKGDRHE